MSRRIAIAILATVWTILIAGGLVAYWTTRAVLLADLDEALIRRAAALPEIAGMSDPAAPSVLHEDDRYLIWNELGQTIARPAVSSSLVDVEPEVLNRNFARLGDGNRLRTVTLRVLAAPSAADGKSEPVTVVYSRSAAGFDRVMNRLAIALTSFGFIGGVAAAAVTLVVTRVAIRPLATTAETIGTIDEKQLDRRINPDALPIELRPLAHRLNEMLARLEQALGQRSRFLADASHELRTPIAALLTTLEVTLRRPRSPEQLRETLQQCLTDARLLQQLAEGLLEHVRSEQPEADEPLSEFDVTALLDECLVVADGLAAGRNVRVIRSLPPAGLQVRCAPRRLRSVVINLLGNAIEYNKHDGTVELSADVQGAGDLVITVQDSGIGISEEHLAHVFEPFFRADHARPVTSGHLGLGLHLVQRHVGALGGQLSASSEVGVGSRFCVRLPGCVLGDQPVMENTRNVRGSYAR